MNESDNYNQCYNPIINQFFNFLYQSGFHSDLYNPFQYSVYNNMNDDASWNTNVTLTLNFVLDRQPNPFIGFNPTSSLSSDNKNKKDDITIDTIINRVIIVPTNINDPYLNLKPINISRAPNAKYVRIYYLNYDIPTVVSISEAERILGVSRATLSHILIKAHKDAEIRKTSVNVDIDIERKTGKIKSINGIYFEDLDGYIEYQDQVK